MQIQVRSEYFGIDYYDTLAGAFQAAKNDPTIWKISFNIESGERVRLILINDSWVFQSILNELGEL